MANDLTTKEGLKINPDIFFKFENGQTLLWDYKNHKQYILEKSYIDRLIALSGGQVEIDENNPIDKDLIAANVIGSYGVDKNADWQWDDLSYLFHVGTQNLPNTDDASLSAEAWVNRYLEYCETISLEQPNLLTEKEGPMIKLPSPTIGALASVSLKDVLLERKTCRQFYGKSVSLEDVATFLYASFGLIHGEWSEFLENELTVMGMRKASPSAGGLHPEEAYLVAMRVDGLKPGLYHYRCHEHVLTEIKLGSFEDKLISMLWQQYYAQGMAFGVFISARFDKSWWKYKHSRAYRTVLYDIGHVSQTSLLVATALGLETWLTAAFHDEIVEEFLGIDGVREAALLFLGAGHGSDEAIDETIKNQLNARRNL